jgi:xanthine dehydrogenase accessory factor
MTSSVIPALATAINNKQPAVLATVVDVKGASPAKLGSQIVLLYDGITNGAVGGGKLEAAILKDGQNFMENCHAGLQHYQLTEEGKVAVGTLCGGEVTVFVQPYFPLPRLVIVGGGHIGRPLKIMGEAAGFEVVVVDVVVGNDTIPELEQITLTQDSYVILITADHVSDEAAMRIALKSPAPYIGMISSLAKWQAIHGNLIKDGYSDQQFSRIFAPIGLDLGGSKPNQIALGILAEVVAYREKNGLYDGIVRSRGRRLST